MADIAWSPDGKFLVVGGFDVALYSEDLELVQKVEHYVTSGFYTESVAWNPQGTYFATFDYDRSPDTIGECALTVWQAYPLEVMYSETSCHDEAAIQNIPIWSSEPVWNPTGEAVSFVGTKDQLTYQLFILNIKTFAISENDPPVRIPQPELGRIDANGITYTSTTGRIFYPLLTGVSRDNTLETNIYTIDIVTGSLSVLVTLAESVDYVSAFENKVALEINEMVHLYDLDTGDLLQDLEIIKFEREFSVPRFDLRELSWSPDGRFLAFGTTDGAGIWEVATGKVVQPLSDDGYISGIAWHPGGTKIAATGSSWSEIDLRIFDVSGLKDTD